MDALPSSSANRRIGGLDEWRGALVLVVMLAHFGVSHLPGIAFHHAYEVAQPLVRESDSTIVAHLLAPTLASDNEMVKVLGWAIDPSASHDDGVTEVKVAFGGQAWRSAQMELPLPGMVDATPQFAHAGWAATLDSRGLRLGQEVPVKVLVRRTDGAEVRFAGSLRWAGLGSARWRVQWIPITSQMAVDHFFVISGFLITLVLVHTKGRAGYLRIFWARRALRILPLAWLLVAVAYVTFPANRSPLPAYLLFYANYYPDSVSLLSPMWSLMVEEHFYLVFPILCWLTPRRWLWVTVGGTCLALTAARLHFPTYYIDGLYVATGMTHIRGIALGLGCWMALLREGLVPRPRLCAGIFVVWACLWAAFGGPEPLFTPYGRLGLLDPASLLVACLILKWLTSRPRSGPGWLRFLGVRCYGLYLLHVPLMFLLARRAPALPAGWFFLLWFPAVVGLAAISFRWFETPLLACAPGYATKGADET